MHISYIRTLVYVDFLLVFASRIMLFFFYFPHHEEHEDMPLSVPSTQTSLFRCARKGRREEDDGRDGA